MLAAVAASLLMTGPVWAHPVRPIEPHDLWSAWSLEPGVLLVIGLWAMLYARGVGRLWQRAGAGRGIPRWRFYCFAAGLAVLLLALVSPLDAMGGVLFSAHMVQHEVLMLVAAPLLVLGLPLISFLWALPLQWRRRLGRWAKLPGVRGTLRTLTHPLTAWLLYAAALWVWHAPALYQATLRSEWVHVAQHASFTGSALLFWWVLLHPARIRRRVYGTSVLYVFTTAVHGSLLGALLTFAREPWYPVYAPSTRAWGLSPLEDQQLGGLIMWIPPGFLYLIVALAALGLWLRGLERRKPRPCGRVEPTDQDSDVAPFPSDGLRRRAVLGGLAALLLTGCDRGADPGRARPLLYGGEPRLGASLIQGYGCGTCHTIPGVRGAKGKVGPPLTDFARRSYIAGNLSNEPQNLVAWIIDPQAVEPGTAMPNLGVSQEQARHIAAYLYTLR